MSSPTLCSIAVINSVKFRVSDDKNRKIKITMLDYFKIVHIHQIFAYQFQTKGKKTALKNWVYTVI